MINLNQNNLSTNSKSHYHKRNFDYAANIIFLRRSGISDFFVARQNRSFFISERIFYVICIRNRMPSVKPRIEFLMVACTIFFFFWVVTIYFKTSFGYFLYLDDFLTGSSLSLHKCRWFIAFLLNLDWKIKLFFFNYQN